MALKTLDSGLSWLPAALRSPGYHSHPCGAGKSKFPWHPSAPGSYFQITPFYSIPHISPGFLNLSEEFSGTTFKRRLCSPLSCRGGCVSLSLHCHLYTISAGKNLKSDQTPSSQALLTTFIPQSLLVSDSQRCDSLCSSWDLNMLLESGWSNYLESWGLIFSPVFISFSVTTHHLWNIDFKHPPLWSPLPIFHFVWFTHSGNYCIENANSWILKLLLSPNCQLPGIFIFLPTKHTFYNLANTLHFLPGFLSRLDLTH